MENYIVRSEFGKALAKLRIDLGLTQRAVARKLEETGLGYGRAATISAIERGVRNPRPEFIRALQLALSLNDEQVKTLSSARKEDQDHIFLGSVPRLP